MPPRLMYVQAAGQGLKGVRGQAGPARIGRVRFSQTGRTLYYAGKTFQSLKGFGYKSNFFDPATGDEYWISGCKKRGGDRLYPGLIEIDDDVRVEYWTHVRDAPQRADERVIRCDGKYRK